MIDFGRRDAGIEEFGVLWNEILTYCRSRFADEYSVTQDQIHFTLEQDNTTIILTISYGPQQTLITRKVIMWTINKSDESEDSELRQEYINQLIAHIIFVISALSQNISHQLLSHNILRTSTYLHEGIDNLIMRRKQLVELYHHTGQINRYTYDAITMNKAHDVTLIDTKDISEID